MSRTYRTHEAGRRKPDPRRKPLKSHKQTRSNERRALRKEHQR